MSMFNPGNVKSNFITSSSKNSLLLIHKDRNLLELTTLKNLDKSGNATTNSIRRDEHTPSVSNTRKLTVEKVTNPNEIRKTIFLLEKNGDKDYGQLLIEELQKPIFQRTKKGQQKKENEKDEWSLVFLLKQIPGFLKFMKYNGIDDATLKAGVDNFGYIKIEKGEYVFREGDSSKRFFGIIKGRISIRLKKKIPQEKKINNNNNENMSPSSSSRYFSSNYFNNTFGSNKNNQRDSIVKLQNRNELLSSLLETQVKNIKNNFTAQHSNSLISNSKNSSSNLHSSPNMASFARRASLLKKFYGHLHDKVGENEEEIIQLTDGMCFGEWALLYNAPRKASAYAAEDTHLFFLDKESFDISFSKSLFKAETERKAFLCNTVPIFKRLPKHKFEEYYRKFVAQFYKRNDMIYRENDKAEYLYIIYQGECSLKRNITKPYKFLKTFHHLGSNTNKESEEVSRNNLNESENKDFNSAIPTANYDSKYLREVEHILKNKDYQNIIKLSKGDIAGLEITAGLDKFNHSLVSDSDHTVVLKISLQHLGEHRGQICSDLLPLYIEKEDIIENYVKSHRNIQKKMKIHYRTFSAHQFNKSNITSNGNGNNTNACTEDEDVEKEKEKDREAKVKTFITTIQSSRPQSQSAFKSMTIESNSNKTQSKCSFNHLNLESNLNTRYSNNNTPTTVRFDTLRRDTKLSSKERAKSSFFRDKLTRLATYKTMKSMQTINTLQSIHNSPDQEKGLKGKLFLTQKDENNIKHSPNTNSNNTNDQENIREALFPFSSEKRHKKSLSIFKPIVFKNVKVISKKQVMSKTVFTYNSGKFDLPMVSLNNTDAFGINSRFCSPNVSEYIESKK